MPLEKSPIDDLPQETFLHLLVAVSRFRGQSALISWVIQVARNTRIDAVRRSVRERAHEAFRDAREADLGVDPKPARRSRTRYWKAAVLGRSLGHAPR